MASLTVGSPAIRIITIPSADQEFARRVDRQLAELGDVTDADLAVEVLVTRLRHSYPDLTVHQQSSLATFGDPQPTWYVYRDSR